MCSTAVVCTSGARVDVLHAAVLCLVATGPFEGLLGCRCQGYCAVVLEVPGAFAWSSRLVCPFPGVYVGLSSVLCMALHGCGSLLICTCVQMGIQMQAVTSNQSASLPLLAEGDRLFATGSCRYVLYSLNPVLATALLLAALIVLWSAVCSTRTAI